MTQTRFITFHLVVSLGLHNLNRDSNGLPKSQYDGGVQRGRMSSQSHKKSARNHFRAMGHEESLRTKLAAFEISRRALALAAQEGVSLDKKKIVETALTAVLSMYAKKGSVTKLVKSQTPRILQMLDITAESSTKEALAVASEELVEEAESETPSEGSDKASQGVEPKDTMVFLSFSEIDGFARAIVDFQTQSTAIPPLVADATSDALDIAAFGRMFAAQSDVGTHGAVAVSHAVTVHQMQLVSDYFSAVEDAAQTHSAAHLGEAYYTSGTYYRTFTIDVDQLHRSWSGIGGEDARSALADLTRALIYALPRGKVNATNASALPRLVLVEEQNFRFGYSFEEPIQAGPEGGYVKATVQSLADQRRQALQFDPSLFGEATVLGDTHGADYQAAPVHTLEDVINFVISKIYQDR